MQNKSVENDISCIDNVVEVQDIRNDKDKVLENLIGNEHAPINIATTLEAGFVDEDTKIFTEQSEYQYYSPMVIISLTDINKSVIIIIETSQRQYILLRIPFYVI